MQYHVIAQIVFPKKDLLTIKNLAKKVFQKEYEAWSSHAFYMPIPLRMVTRLDKDKDRYKVGQIKFYFSLQEENASV